MSSETHRKAGLASVPEALRHAGLPNVHLKIGEGIVTHGNVLISTVLGSCISVSFYHARSGLAGIFHAMLPSSREGTYDGKTPCKFVDSAIGTIYQQFQRRGLANRELELKLFGGAFSMGVGASPDVQQLVNVGARNVEVARKVLHELGLSIQRENVGGDRGRKLVFNTRTGDVWMKMLGKAEQQVLLSEERVYVPVAEGRACSLNRKEPS